MIIHILPKLTIGTSKSFIYAKTLATVENDIEPLKTSVSEGKSLIAAAVTDKGVQTAADDTFQIMADNIKKIPEAVNISNAEVIPCTSPSTLETRCQKFTIPINKLESNWIYLFTCYFKIYSSVYQSIFMCPYVVDSSSIEGSGRIEIVSKSIARADTNSYYSFSNISKTNTDATFSFSAAHGVSGYTVYNPTCVRMKNYF